MSLRDVMKALDKDSLTADERAAAVALAEEELGARAAENRSDVIAELQAKPEPKKSKKKGDK